MHASVGDGVVVHGRTVGSHDRKGEILEVHGPGGTEPFLVRFDDGHEALIYPGPDMSLVHYDPGHQTSAGMTS